MADIYMWASWALVPVSNIITWIATKSKRRNETMQSLQETIELFAKSNEDLSKQVIEQNITIAKLTTEITSIKKENELLKSGQEKMLKELSNVRKENKELKTLLSKQHGKVSNTNKC